MRFGFYQVTAISPRVEVANVTENLKRIELAFVSSNSDVVVFPELCLTGYTCGDLFGQTALLNAVEKALDELASLSDFITQVLIVGAPIRVGNALYNCGVVIHQGKIVGIVPKTHIPNYKEFYEHRWFRPADGTEPTEINLSDREHIPFGTNLLFENDGLIIGLEICEDLWMPIPPSSHHALAGANLLINLSASPETISKADYRRDLVVGQSGRCVAAYLYASAGPTESTTDLVFGGHCLIAENGTLLEESRRVGDGKFLPREGHQITTQIDVEKLQGDRRTLTPFLDCESTRFYRRIPLTLEGTQELTRHINGKPFVPHNPETLKQRCDEVFGIQSAGLAKRLEIIPNPEVHIGVSGGLDSTLALLVAVEAFESLELGRDLIHGYSLPGFGTTSETSKNAGALMRLLGVRRHIIDIRQSCLNSFVEVEHKPFGIALQREEGYVLTVEEFMKELEKVPSEKRKDVKFENVQARRRTEILMGEGFVLGTGDMSEAALGWSTYNADHLSMYNPNCSVPKTLVKWIILYLADTRYSHQPEVQNVLRAIAGTTISPELLPVGTDGEIEHSTEEILGPYELHDFFLFHFIRNGFSPAKILFLAKHAEFEQVYSEQEIRKTLKIFLERFFQQQYKRSCVPDGPKVGSVSLSPRGDWRMPSDAVAREWLDALRQERKENPRRRRGFFSN